MERKVIREEGEEGDQIAVRGRGSESKERKVFREQGEEGYQRAGRGR